MPFKEEKIGTLIKELAGKFLNENSTGISLLTVTSVSFGVRNRTAIIFFTVFPEKFEKEALEFTKRRRSDFREYLREHSRLQYLPVVDFKIDLGEKNRQRIEELGKTA